MDLNTEKTMIMEKDIVNDRSELRERYGFKDFLFYTCLLAVPIFTAILAIFRHSVGWGILYILLAGVLTGCILKFYCAHCPHYTRDEKRLNCMFFWGFPKLFNPRPGPLGPMDTLIAFGAPAVLLIFPLYWLFQEPGLLILYLLSLAGFGASVYRNECHRCIYDECPINKVPQSKAHEAEIQKG